jgi:hypothetical protein
MMTPVDMPLALHLPSSSTPLPVQQSAPSLVADTSPSAMQAVGPDDVGAELGEPTMDEVGGELAERGARPIIER